MKKLVVAVLNFSLIVQFLGIIYVLVGYVIYYLLPSFNIYLSAHLIGFILLFCNIFLTGALHCDGFTDTMDGILSGRKRQSILEIMKDNHTSAGGSLFHYVLIRSAILLI